MTDSKLGEDLGFLFEVGFNIGILAYIEQKQFKHRFEDLYRHDLQQLSFSRILKRLKTKQKVINPGHRKIIEKWSLFFLQKSFLAGLNFFEEYIESTGWTKHRLKHLEILYYQCCFAGNNSIGTYDKEKEKIYRELLSQFGDIKVDTSKYSRKGQFLNADTL
ncbi:MAG: helicase, partial [Prochloraceae cyanobacterium]|nr:helicase [Prochloraceae cyanobacterium]